MRIKVIDTPELGDRSYLVHDGETGLVIDPQRDTGRITALAGRLGVRIGLVAETHIHNDYVTGGYVITAAQCRLKNIQQARPLCRKCRRFLRQPQHRFAFSMLVDAMADYHAQTGDLSTAEAYWRLAPPEEPFFESAARGLVKLQAVRGHTYASAGRATLQKAHAESNQGLLDLILPGNEKSRLADVLKDLQKYSSALTRIVPKRDLWKFGLDPASL